MTMLTPNDVPDAPEWFCEGRPCPIPCGICTTPTESAWMHGAGERLHIPDNIELGGNAD